MTTPNRTLMKPSEVKVIVEALGGIKKAAKFFERSESTIRRWLRVGLWLF